MQNPTARNDLDTIVLRLGDVRDVLLDKLGQKELGEYVHALAVAVAAARRSL